MAARPWTTVADGVDLVVRVTPRGGRDAVEGIEERSDGRTVLRVRLRAVASEGAANESLVRFLAKNLGVAPREVSLIAGATSRIKRLRIAGPSTTIVAALEKIAAIG